jgi:hypothetical protein
MQKQFLDASREYLLDVYLPKIRLAIAPLSEEDLWWRPIEGSNCIGNLMLHNRTNRSSLLRRTEIQMPVGHFTWFRHKQRSARDKSRVGLHRRCHNLVFAD